MMITVKTTKKLLASISLAAFILSSHLLWAGNVVFTDYSLNELKVVEIDTASTTVSLESPNGDSAILTVGDVVGQEGATISEIHELMIILEGPPDASGKKSKTLIPIVRIGTSVPLETQ